MIKLLVVVLVILCSGCMKPYYGYSEKEWSNLSENEKKAAKEEYQQIIDAKNSQSHSDLINERKQSVIDLGVSAQ